MNLILKLAWRNIWRNWRRSLITILAVFFAVFLSVVMRAMQLGTYDANIKTAVRIFTGYMQIQHEGYKDNPSLLKSFKLNKNLKTAIDKNEHIQGCAPRVESQGLISYHENSLGAMIIGIDKDKEKKVTTIQDKIHEGRNFKEGAIDEIVVGYKMLENLEAEIGDTVVMMAQCFDRSMGNRLYKVVGTMKMGAEEFDGMACFMDIKAASELLAMGNRLTSVALSLEKVDDIPQVKQYLKNKIENPDLTILDWEELMPDFKQSIQLDNISGILMLIMLVIIVSFGILNTMVMSITERYNEFGVMLALGTENSRLVTIVFFELIFITILGIIFGNIFAAGVNYYLVLNPIVLGGKLGGMMEEFGFIPAMHSTMDIAIFLRTSIGVFAIAMLVYFYPAYKLFKLEPLKGIRFT